ncbi:MAG: TonB-dependent receptor [Candidatus Handelsmanbacteria bacterium]|nr:TonB-dependent receptor [Candidatus Handelsmanbacteria bacterium]
MCRIAHIAALAVLTWLPGAVHGANCGRVTDARTGEGIGGAWIRISPSGARTYSDSSGFFCLGEVPAGTWSIEVERLGYQSLRREETPTLLLQLQPQPLLLPGLTVAAPRPGETEVATFVEHLPVEAHRPESLPQILERAAGVQVRRQGGLGSFSTASIRGSTAEQLLVLVDGVPLNQAIGGGVDLGRLLMGGVGEVEVYRGAVPARFGGNSLGGAVNLRTRAPAARPRLALQGMGGSFATWQASAALSGPWRGGQYLGLVEGMGSRNNFSFRDDNGTPYNPGDDEDARRRNSDFSSLRLLAKAERPWGMGQVRASHTLDLRHQGVPGIGNYQALQVRFDTWQGLSRAELAGPFSAAAGYELSLYHSLQQDTYKDLAGEVGTGVQHHRNTTQGYGAQGAFHRLWGRTGSLTLRARLREEHFFPRDMFRPAAPLPHSRRRAALLGGEGELGQGRLRLLASGQVEGVWDWLAGAGGIGVAPGRVDDQPVDLPGGQVGAEWALGPGLALQLHLGRHLRPASFYELFGDRGAVIGNPALRRERGLHWDGGLRLARPGPAVLRRLELAGYRKETRNLIRFVQNSQQVSRPHNIGRALVRGLELRTELGLGPARLSGNYTYQRALNQSAFPSERGRDLPNAPRHSFNLRSEAFARRCGLYHELNGESRQYLDRANLRPVAGRLLHTLGARLRPRAGFEATAEVRNLGDIQVEDLWGYPLPGRSFFLALNRDFGAGQAHPPSPETEE